MDLVIGIIVICVLSFLPVPNTNSIVTPTVTETARVNSRKLTIGTNVHMIKEDKAFKLILIQLGVIR